MTHLWHPIQPLPDEWESLANEELPYLSKVWKEQKDTFENTEGYSIFLTRMCREWAIETGAIENLYTINEGVTQLLIEQGIDSSLISHLDTKPDPEFVANIIRDQHDAVEGIFMFIKGDRSLTVSYIKEMHHVFTRHQDHCLGVDGSGRRIQVQLEKGVFKRMPNNPVRSDGAVHEYCPPEQVDSEMDKLIILFNEYDNDNIPPEILSSWLHHRFTQIHPFQDGNGRLARALSTIVFLKAAWFPLTVLRKDKEQYISALEQADKGNLLNLVTLFSKMQKKSFVNALSIVGEITRKVAADELIDAIIGDISAASNERKEEWDNVKSLSLKLENLAFHRFESVAKDLEQKLRTHRPWYKFKAFKEKHGDDKGHWFRGQLVQTAKELNYYANLNTYYAWTRLRIKAESQLEILVFYSALGYEFTGIISVSACIFRRVVVADKESMITDYAPLTEDIFQINYCDTDEQMVCNRFNRWLDAVLGIALQSFRKSIGK